MYKQNILIRETVVLPTIALLDLVQHNDSVIHTLDKLAIYAASVYQVIPELQIAEVLYSDVQSELNQLILKYILLIRDHERSQLLLRECI